MKKIFLVSIITIISVISGYGQDIHFSQFYQTPLQINPALTGVFRGDQRVIINYKDQWRSISNPFTTYALSLDMAMFKKQWAKGYLGAGLFVFSDKAGKSEFGTTQANLSLSGIVPLSNKHLISAGLQGGFAQRGIQNTDLIWDNEYTDGTNDDPTMANKPSFGFGDFSGGVHWRYGTDASTMTSNDAFGANAGIAFFHINRPKQDFNVSIDKLYTKLAFHGGGYIGIKNTNIVFLPSVLFFMQGPSIETNVGTLVKYILKQESKYTKFVKGSAISIGGHFRIGDAFIPSLLLEVANFAVGMSYDINVSSLRVVSSGRGGFEISLRYINPNPFQKQKARSLL